MTRTVGVGACQTPDIRGDVDGALDCIETYAEQAAAQGVQLLCFPEGFLQGYETKDKRWARRHALDLDSAAFAQVLHRLARIQSTLVIGLTELEAGTLYNTAVVVKRGVLLGRYRKTRLLEGERRIFEPGRAFPVFTTAGLKFGISICYDTAFPETAAAVATQGVDLIVCPANNMMRYESAKKHRQLHNAERAKRCLETSLWLVSADVTGERDGCISYGPTAFINPEGRVIAQVPLQEPGMVVAEVVVRECVSRDHRSHL